MKKIVFNRLITFHLSLFLFLCMPQSRADDDLYDLFYDDDTTATLNVFGTPEFSQVHNFWSLGDEDWARFNVISNSFYSVNVTDQATSCDAIIYLFNESNLTSPVITPRDDWGPGGADELISWYSGPTSGTMFIKVTQSPNSPNLSGDGTTYTLTVTGDWGANVALQIISGTTSRSVGPGGGDIQVPENSTAASLHLADTATTYIYTNHQASFPPGALNATYTFRIGAAPDLGSSPSFDSTKAWLLEHPNNASLVWLSVTSTAPSTINLLNPATITVQFKDDWGIVNSLSPLTIDDLPPGTSAANMRVHRWNPTTMLWEVIPGPQTVNGDTVSAEINTLTHQNYFAAAPVEQASGVGEWWLFE